MRYVVGSGWWCNNPKGVDIEHGKHKVGHRLIRSLTWHGIWKRVLFEHANPVKTIVVDSASPVIPEHDDRVEWVRLDRNYQYAGLKYNGWIRGFMVGAWYAWNCEADFIYVEQDCLVIGEGWVDKLYERAEGKHPLFGRAFKSPIQQSLVFLPSSVIPAFLHGVAASQGRMTCEKRFQQVGQKLGARTLPFGVGRIRPIQFKAPCFYAQHWTEPELLVLAKRLGMKRNLMNDAIRSVS